MLFEILIAWDLVHSLTRPLTRLPVVSYNKQSRKETIGIKNMAAQINIKLRMIRTAQVFLSSYYIHPLAAACNLMNNEMKQVITSSETNTIKKIEE